MDVLSLRRQISLSDRARTEIRRIIEDLDIEGLVSDATYSLDLSTEAGRDCHYDVCAIIATFGHDLTDKLRYVLRLLEIIDGDEPYVAGIEISR